MPRNDLKAYTTVLARIPQDLADQVKQYASVHRRTVSELIREGLEMRLEAEVPGRSPPRSTDHGDEVFHEVFHEVLQVLNTMAPRLQAAVRETITEVLPKVIPSAIPVSPPIRQGMTKVVHTDTQEQTSADKVLHKVSPHDTADAPVSPYGAGCDTTRFVVGELCPQRHRYQDTAGSLRYVKGDHDCVTCRSLRSQRTNEHKRAKRRQKAAPQQQG